MHMSLLPPSCSHTQPGPSLSQLILGKGVNLSATSVRASSLSLQLGAQLAANDVTTGDLYLDNSSSLAKLRVTEAG